VQLAKDQAKRIDSAMGVPEEIEIPAISPPEPLAPAIIPAVAPTKSILVRTPTLATTMRKGRKNVNFAARKSLSPCGRQPRKEGS
jgi:hypothetical protein